MDLPGQAAARQRLRLTKSLSPPRKRFQNGLALKVHLPAQRLATYLTLQARETPPNDLHRQNIAPQFLNSTPTASRTYAAPYYLGRRHPLGVLLPFLLPVVE